MKKVLRRELDQHEYSQKMATHNADSYAPYARATQYYIVYNEDKDSFTYAVSEFKEGKHGPGKRYFYWEQTQLDVVQFMPSGYFRYLRRAGKSVYSQAVFDKNVLLKSFALWQFKEYPEFKEWVESKPTVNEDHPLLKQYHLKFPDIHNLELTHINTFDHANVPFLSTLLRSENPMELTRALFGKRRYRRDLVKAVAEASITHVGVAWAARGTMPIDWIIAFLRESQNINTPVLQSKDYQNIRKVLKLVRPKAQKRILWGLDNLAAIGLLEDVAKLIGKGGVLDPMVTEEDFKNSRINNLESLHDYVYASYRLNMKMHQAKDFDEVKPMSELGEKLHETQIDDNYRISVAQRKRDLVDWGAEMRSCMGSYTRHLPNKRRVYGAIYTQHDQLVSNFEIQNNTLKQLLGKYNNALEPELREKVVAVFKEHEIATDEFWGQ